MRTMKAACQVGQQQLIWLMEVKGVLYLYQRMDDATESCCYWETDRNSNEIRG